MGLLLAAGSLSAENPATRISAEEALRKTATVSYREYGIHDPSIYYCGDVNQYYIMGSHIGFGRTSDLVNVTGLSNKIYTRGYDKEFKSSPEHQVSVVRDGTAYSEVLGSFDAAAHCATYAGVKVGTREPVSEAQWVSGDQWAPDVIYNPHMKKWCMYLSLNGDYWASVIVMLTSDRPDGDFQYTAPIVFGGFNGQTYSGVSVDYKNTDLELVLGPQSELPSRYRTSAWGDIWPNCIDPCVFFDDEGELWMAYGSWSGGIFMLKLDKNTGLRDYTAEYPLKKLSDKCCSSDPYFGTHIAGGAYVSGEGAYIQKIGEYYYLFLSYGGLESSKGYEMRIFRSKSPDGPYVDGTGASAEYTSYLLNYGPNAKTNKGMKIIGAFNNWGSMTVGETAEGHNSAIVDPEGDAFVVYHTKFNNGTEGFQVRFRQLFVNSIGWLVASPYRFTGKQTRQTDIETRRIFTPEEIAGTYQLLYHPYRLDHNNMKESVPMSVTLTADGKVEGARKGTWEYTEEGKSFVKIRLGDVEYNGMAMRQNVDGYADMPAVCFTAVSNTGVPVWLTKFGSEEALADACSRIYDWAGNEDKLISCDAPKADNVATAYSATNAETGGAEPETISAEGVYTKTADGHRISVTARCEAAGYFLECGPFVRATMGENYVEPEVPVYYPESCMKNLDAGWWSNFSKEDYLLEKGRAVTLFFVNEKSYIDGSELDEVDELYKADAIPAVGARYDIFGRRAGEDYNGIVIVNSKKYIAR